jgi:hypothetical protein
MLRRSHDHHREIRARRDAVASPDRPTYRNQDRYLMTAPARQLQSRVRLHRRSSTRRSRLRSNIGAPSQIAPTSPPFNRQTRPFINRIAINQRAAATRHDSRTSSAAAKSP